MTTTIGYIGLDHHHRSLYLDSIDQLDAEVTAVADSHVTPDTLGIDRLTDLPLYNDPIELLDNADIDLAWVTLPNRATPSVIEKAVGRGIDVFTEKPAARSAADLEPVAERARASDVTVGVSFIWRMHPISRRLCDLAESGFFGNVRGFDLRFMASQLSTRNMDHYLFDATESRGGIVQWLGVHWLDLLPWILRDPIVRVNATMSAGTPGVDVEDVATLQIETESGAIGTLQCGYVLREGRYDTAVNVYGEMGRSKWDPMGETFGFDGETVLELDSSADGWGSTPHRQYVHEYEPTPGYGGRWGLDFFEQFLAACRGDTTVPADLDNLLTVLRVLDAAYESAETDGWVAIDQSQGTEMVPAAED
jgi:predicted dehydrogenase